MLTPAETSHLINTAMTHHLAGRLNEAEAIYQHLLRACSPLDGDATHLYGVLLAQRGQYEEALPLLRQAIDVMPSSAECHRHLADTLALMNRPSDSQEVYRMAVACDPRDVNAHHGMARTLAELHRNEEAAIAFQKVLALAPLHASAMADLGIVLARIGRWSDSILVLSQAVQLNPNLGEAWTMLSHALCRVGRVDEALDPAQRGSTLQPGQPWAITAVGNVFQILGRFPDAVHQYEASLAVEQNNFDAINNLGLTLLKMGEAERSMALFDDAMARWPESRALRVNRALALLTLGRWREGFAEYEMRVQLPGFATPQIPVSPRWNGGDVADKTVVLHAEQGLGDTVQFIRYIPLLAGRGAAVVLVCSPLLHELAATVSGVKVVISNGEPTPPHDLWAPLASLPQVFGTEVSTVPNHAPYVHADPERADAWRQRLGSDTGLKVGVVWAGTPDHMNDRARSCRLEDFAPLTQVPGARLYSLQKGPAADALAFSPLAAAIVPLGDSLNDFADTAAALESLDLLISVDTSVVHVAGALTRPTWILLARGPDWRWLHDREDTPWYQSVRLFRQQELGNWQGVIARVAAALSNLVAQRAQP